MSCYDICVITTIHPPMDQRIYGRGVQSYLAHGYKVCIIAPWPKIDSSNDSIHWITVPSIVNRWQKLLHAYRVFSKALGVKSKIYHFHDLDFIVFGALLSLLRRSKVIYDDHENYKEDILYNKAWLPKNLRRPVAWSVSLLESICARIIGNVIVPVEGMKKRFNDLHINTAVIHNYSSYQPQAELEYGAGLVYIGSLTITYGLYTLIEIARELKKRNRNIPIVMTEKNANEDTKKILQKCINEEGLLLNILPIMPFTMIHTLMKRGKIGLSVMQDSPEKRISIASKIFEYMAYGLPVVGENFGYTKKIIEESGCGLVADSSNPIAFTNAIIKLYDDSIELKKCREKGFVAIEQKYNWQREEKNLQEFIYALMPR